MPDAWHVVCMQYSCVFIYLRTNAVTSSLSQLQRCETRAKVAAPTGYALCSRLLGQGPVKPIWKRLILVLYINLYIFLHVQMFDIYEFPKSNSFMSLVQWSTLTIQEELVTSVFRENGMYYPVKIETVTSKPLDSLNFPWIPPSAFIRAMGANNDLGHILGGHTLKEARGMLETFWSRYRAIYPKHGLWSDVDSHKKTLHRCIPIFVHGDEGVTFKKNGLLVISFQGCIGWGSSKRSPELEENYRAAGQCGIPLNFLRTGFQTRILICVCPKDWVFSKLTCTIWL